MSKAKISFDKDLSKETERRIKANLRKIHSAITDLVGMGYNLYLTPSNLHVCDGDTHDKYARADTSVVVATLYVYGIDGGDW